MVSDARPICKMFGPMGTAWVALIAYLVWPGDGSTKIGLILVCCFLVVV